MLDGLTVSCLTIYSRFSPGSSSIWACAQKGQRPKPPNTPTPCSLMLVVPTVTSRGKHYPSLGATKGFGLPRGNQASGLGKDVSRYKESLNRSGILCILSLARLCQASPSSVSLCMPPTLREKSAHLWEAENFGLGLGLRSCPREYRPMSYIKEGGHDGKWGEGSGFFFLTPQTLDPKSPLILQFTPTRAASPLPAASGAPPHCPHRSVGGRLESSL